MKLYAISDLHLSYAGNRAALAALPPQPDDWLIVAGDIGERAAHLEFALSILTRRFAQLIWTPGNHDLWTLPSDRDGPRGVAHYQRLVAICRRYGVLTPEDPFVRWPGPGPACLLAPIFTLYDYSFRPPEIAAGQAVAWAIEDGVLCTDEELLHADPYPSRADWCAARCAETAPRLQQASSQAPLVLIGHFPLRQDLVWLPRIPRFSLWCGTRRTDNWHTRFRAHTVVYGHLHIPGSHLRDGVRFEEVSFGYPPDRQQVRALQPYLREILPGAAPST